MIGTCIFLIIILLIALLVILIYFYCHNRKQISGFGQVQSSDLAYADISAPYDTPFILQNILSKDKCKEIMSYAMDKLVDSEVVGGKHTGVRNSKQCWIHKSNPMVKPIFDQVSKMFGIPFENAEDMQVVRYLPGQYYNEHHDACCDNNDKCVEFVNKGGQRALTVLIYLNNDFTDGHTYFKNLNLKVKPLPGDAIVFYPLAKDSNHCHPLALHAGMPVSSGEKWIANLWYRESNFNA